MEESTVIRRMQPPAGYALIMIVIELVAAAWQALAEKRRHAKARSELRRLSDRMLKDIGLERAEIDGLFRQR